MAIEPPVKHPSEDLSREGFFYALSAFLIWGLLPLYWKQTAHLDPVDVTAHRALWSLPVAGIILWFMGRTSDILTTFRSGKNLAILFVCAVLISFNWGVFIWAISVERTIEAALAYYINPLVSVAMGGIFLRERFNNWQLVAICLAAGAVVLLTVLGGTFPWISISLALTFALYGLLRKTVAVGPVQGFFVEIALIFPIALAYIVLAEPFIAETALQSAIPDWVLIMLAGPATAVPLMLYASGAKRLRLATIGMMQYIAPTMIFLIGLFVFGETITYWQWIAFIMIWSALVVYSWSMLRQSKAKG